MEYVFVFMTAFKCSQCSVLAHSNPSALEGSHLITRLSLTQLDMVQYKHPRLISWE